MCKQESCNILSLFKEPHELENIVLLLKKDQGSDAYFYVNITKFHVV